MAKKVKKKESFRKKLQSREGCPFCKDKKLPAWNEAEALQEFLSPRGRILGREMTGVCVKHQKLLSESVKRARHLAILPFVTQE